MIHKVVLPNGSSIGIQYSNKVYSPKFSSYRDTIGLAQMCIDEVNPKKLIDVGCGAGVLGLALKKLNPLIDVYLSDPDPEAIKQTKRNAERLGLRVTTLNVPLLPQTQFFPLIIANLPTFNQAQLNEGSLHGPEGAYLADPKDGLALYKKLLDQAQEGNFLICEVQERLQPDFYRLLASKPEYVVVATSQMALALLKRASASL